jgi:hypothetical protein
MKLFVCLLAMLLVFAGCKKRETIPPPPKSANQESAAAQFDVCGLLKNEEIEAIQGSPIKETKNSGQSDGGFRIWQCFYMATEFNRSVSVAVTQSDPGSPVKRSPKEFWKETFGPYEIEEREREGDKEKRESLREQTRERGEEEASIAPKRITGIGDEAFWTPNRMGGGALYVLKKDSFIRVSVGGPDNEQIKIDKSKALAEKALARL